MSIRPIESANTSFKGTLAAVRVTTANDRTNVFPKQFDTERMQIIADESSSYSYLTSITYRDKDGKQNEYIIERKLDTVLNAYNATKGNNNFTVII